MKNRIKLNESTLKQIIAESVSRILKEEGEGIEMMGSIPSGSHGKYGELMEKLYDIGDEAIEFILTKNEMVDGGNFRTLYQNGLLDGRDFSTKQFSSEQVFAMLESLKNTLIHALDTRYW